LTGVLLWKCYKKRVSQKKWISWMRQININGTPGGYFRTFKGLRQGDPLSPLLFNLVSDAFATMFKKAREAGTIKGLVPRLVGGGLTHLQYADDTIIFLELEEGSILYANFLLYCFENMSGLRINYQKSEVFVIGADLEEQERVADIFNCNVGTFPLKYLGVMISDKHMCIPDLAYIHQKVSKRLPTW
jgi:hypothetical protein